MKLLPIAVGLLVGGLWGLAAHWIPPWLHLSISVTVCLIAVAYATYTLRQVRKLERKIDEWRKEIFRNAPAD